MTPPFVDAATLHRLVDVETAISVIEEGFRRRSPGDDPLRSVTDVAAGQLLLMPAEGELSVGVKIVSIGPGVGAPRIQGVYVLMDAETLALRALMDGSAITALRTPAVSAVASARLAVPHAERLAVIGAGPQAEAHVHALRMIRPITTVHVLSRTGASAQRLAARLREQGLHARVGDPADLGSADVVCACTTSRVPVVRAAELAPHAHVNAVGSHEPDAREVDSALVRSAQVAVETRSAALAEAGDIIIPLSAGEVGEDVIRWDLAELVRGEGPEPDPGALSLFKSVGIAYEDLLVAEAVFQRWL